MAWTPLSFSFGAVLTSSQMTQLQDNFLSIIGPNYLVNGDFESTLAGWTSTAYTGGSVANGASNETGGASGLVITCGTTSNGGGNVVSNQFIPVTAQQTRQYMLTVKGSDATVPINAEVRWFNDAQTAVTQTATMTIATPCVVTATGAGGAAVQDGSGVVFTNSGGALPTGVVSGTTYFTRWVSGDTYHLYDTAANAMALASTTGRVNTSGSQSGTHTISINSTAIISTASVSPTTDRLVVRRIKAPAGARYAKIKLELPATGSTSGDVLYFDSVIVTTPQMLGGMQVFTSSGTFGDSTDEVWGDVYVEVKGAGGTGGGGAAGGTYAGGGAGGGGEGGTASGFCTVSGSVTVTVGATSAASSSFAAGATLSATGGSAGNTGGVPTGGIGGTGGVGSGGTVNIRGCSGASGGTGSSGGTGVGGVGGSGGNGGSGGTGQAAGVNGGTGSAGSAYGQGGGGGGGGGADAGSGGGSGGGGGSFSAGVVIVRW